MTSTRTYRPQLSARALRGLDRAHKMLLHAAKTARRWSEDEAAALCESEATRTWSTLHEPEPWDEWPARALAANTAALAYSIAAQVAAAWGQDLTRARSYADRACEAAAAADEIWTEHRLELQDLTPGHVLLIESEARKARTAARKAGAFLE